MSRRFMLDLAAIQAAGPAFVAMMLGMKTAGAALFVVCSPGVKHDEVLERLKYIGAPATEVFVSAAEPGDALAISAWKANVAKSLQVDMFFGADEQSVRTAFLLGIPSALVMT